VAGPIRVGVVGCGEIAQIMHLRFLDELSDFEVVALCDLSETVLASLGERYRVTQLLTDYARLVELPDVDAVAVCTPDHAGPVMAALAAGKHVFCEKPLAFDEATARELAEASKRSPAVSMVGYMRLFDPAYEYLTSVAAAIEPIRLVELHDFMARFDKHSSLFPLVIAPKSETEDSAANTVSDRFRGPLARSVGPDPAAQALYWHMLMGASHDVSMLRGAFGPPTDVLFAKSDGPSRLVAYLEYKGHATATLAIDITAGYEWWDQQVTLYGSAEKLTLSLANPYIPYLPSRVTRRSGDGQHELDSDVIVSYESPFRREWQHFAECIATGAAPRSSFDDAVSDVAVLAAMVRAAYPGADTDRREGSSSDVS
jgi:predicted dehydrogenase